MALSKEKIDGIFAEYGGSGQNTGSIDGQVALLTAKIQALSDHLQKNKKDHSSRRTLLKYVGQRKRYLQYLAKKDITNYRSLIEKLGLRK